MKYYVFIARDEEEFSRYPGLRGGFHEKTPGFLKSVRYIEEDGYCVLILPHEAKNVDADGNVDVRRMCTNVAAAINGIGHKYNDADKICILVHLGGEGSGGVDKWEQDLNVKLKDIKDASTSDNREKWSIKLLSSTRKDIIDITAGTITIPERADLERLVGGKWRFDIKKFVRRLKRLQLSDKNKSLYIEETFVNIGGKSEYELPSNYFIPLILSLNKETLRGSGVISPREYIVDLSGFEKLLNNVVIRGMRQIADSKVKNKEKFIWCVFFGGICKLIEKNYSIETNNIKIISAKEGYKYFKDKGIIPKLLEDNEKNKNALFDIFSSGIEFCNKEILQRLEFLEPVSKDEYKAWFLPLFRKYCFQDEHAHGGSHLIDLPRVGDFGGIFDGKGDDNDRRSKKIDALIKRERVKDECDSVKDDGFGCFIKRETKGGVSNEACWFDARFSEETCEIHDPYLKYKNLLSFLFCDELKELKEKYKDIPNSDGKERCDAWLIFKATMAVLLSELVNKKEIGLPLSYLSPTKKINVLVVDDKGDDTVKELANVEAFRDIFSFYPLQIKISDALSEGDTIINYAIDKIRKEVESGRTYEVVLLDLSLGEDPGYDLMGYHIVYRIKQFMPQSKIMIYSKLDDMGHIVRALGQGASWYLRKYNKHKLPRHVFSMLRAMEWKKEWRTVWSNRLCDFTFDNPEENRDFIRSFDGKRKYLTYKCLERYPGVMISIKPMKGGLSASATFKAVKGLIADGDPIQTPVIVKIDTAHATRLEYERYFRFIRPYIANESGRVENPEIVLDDENAAIVYTYAGKQDPYHGLDTMKSMFVRDIKSRSSCDYQKYEKTFDSIFNEILPQIHQVSPQVEFSPLEAGSADIAARDLPKVSQTNFSDYPNHVFGEFCKLQSLEDNAKDEELFNKGFLANYLCRMPVVRKLEGLDDKKSFREQTNKFTIIKNSNDGGQDSTNGNFTRYYEYHDKNKSGECTITSYDLSDKCSVIMKGKAVDHIVKYRPYTYPCMALWVWGKKEAKSELQLEEGLKDKIAAAYNEINNVLAVNMFSEAVYDFLGENPSAGRPTSMYFQQVCCRKVVGDKFCEILQSIGDKERSAFQSVIKMKDYIDELLKDKKLRKKLQDCPIGIVHGDLNCANIMLETRKNVSKIVEFSDAVPNIRDVWFIDFARTRRDFISHDFNVMFTSVLALLFDKDVWEGKMLSCNDMTYRTSDTGWQMASLRGCITNREQINAVYRDFIVAAVTGELDAVPDFIEKDKRMSFIFRVLRRIRKAALRAGISEECYLLTTALSCTVASRIALVHEKNAPASAAMIAAAVICLAEIKA